MTLKMPTFRFLLFALFPFAPLLADESTFLSGTRQLTFAGERAGARRDPRACGGARWPGSRVDDSRLPCERRLGFSPS